VTSLLSLIGVLHANYWGVRWLDEPLGQNIWGRGGSSPSGPMKSAPMVYMQVKYIYSVGAPAQHRINNTEIKHLP